MNQVTKVLIGLWSIVIVLGIGILIQNDESSWSTVRSMFLGALGLSAIIIIGTKISMKR